MNHKRGEPGIMSRRKLGLGLGLVAYAPNRICVQGPPPETVTQLNLIIVFMLAILRTEYAPGGNHSTHSTC